MQLYAPITTYGTYFLCSYIFQFVVLLKFG